MITKKTTAKKAPVKKVAKKTVPTPAAAPVLPKDPETFYVTVKANGAVFTSQNFDIEQALIDACPRIIKTNMTVVVEKDGKIAENFLLLMKAKLLLRNRIGTYIFCSKLIFK